MRTAEQEALLEALWVLSAWYQWKLAGKTS